MPQPSKPCCAKRTLSKVQATLDTPILVEGSRLSPLQYRWLFSDLRGAIGAQDEAAALSHYRDCGQAEIQQGRRPVDPDRLLKLKLQAMSPSLPDLPPPDYYRLHQGEGPTLDIVFTFTFMPAGDFNFVEFTDKNTTLLINTSQNDFYQRGVPGVTRSIDETAQWLRSVVQVVGATRIRTFGASMGGYAALLFGMLIEADAVYAAAPLIVLGQEGCRSLTWNEVKVYDPAYRSLVPYLPRLAGKANVVFPLYSPFEYSQISAYLSSEDSKPMFVHDFHPGAMALDWAKIMRSSDTPSLSDGITFDTPGQTVSRRTIELAIKADEALRTKRLPSAATALRALVEDNPDNMGLRYFLGAASLALGERDAAATLLQNFADREAAFSFDLPRETFLANWKARLLEDFSHVLSAAMQRQLLSLVAELWNARAER